MKMEEFDNQPLVAFLSTELDMTSQSLAELSGEPLPPAGLNASGLVKRVTIAWSTPLDELSCAQARVLTGQKRGLEWIARPVALFVARYPQAFCDLYEGDLTVNALLAHEELARHALKETRAMLECDYRWLAEEYVREPDSTLLGEALAALAIARKRAGVQRRMN